MSMWKPENKQNISGQTGQEQKPGQEHGQGLGGHHERNYQPEHGHEHQHGHQASSGRNEQSSSDSGPLKAPLDHHADEAHRHEHVHAHGHSHSHAHAPNTKKGLLTALIITAGIMVLEFAGGLITDSLALLSDSGHMLSDTASLALSLIAVMLAAKPATSRNSYGFYRIEILAALFNGATLFIIAGFIMWEAWQRFAAPPEVAGGTMMVIAAIGLLANLASAWALTRRSGTDNINVRSAYLHVMGDALGSVGALLAGLLMQLFSWYIADPIISVLVALLILRSAWNVIKQAFHILMEGTPHTVDAAAVKEALLSVEGVYDIHDLHIWSITSGMDALSAHLTVRDGSDFRQILQEALDVLEQRFGVDHATLQIEDSALRHGKLRV
ncbi:cation diffusion facilitator family transporter [Paenibacillus tepidiphilus]|uniref:cation diffusion facilitator family transporter n=1 Tax=Paenibacillus tepidiphilus TaxID=2608683 RepID=UPI001EF0C1EF|nr:cation diffusion facilitator family transporter [Paenibacillus tepidiphilus]